ncbi:MAG: hypothetical protein AYK18_13480 [Theionarchaea archaeon DG-70]|nr:MAG: hypothetical protein AYK18_13480 [Theionarchaea archaeon DG-70]
MKKGKFLEVLRIAVVCIVLDKKGSMSLTELGSFLGCKKTLIVEYARAHETLFEISNNSISSKRISLRSNENIEKNSRKFILELLNFAETICDIPSDQIVTKKFLEWL